MTTANPHFNAFQGSYSRDRAGMIFTRMKAQSAMCVNDWELLRTIIQRGGTPVHRHRAPQDDDADSHIDPIEYVNTAHTQALAAEAGGAQKTIIHLGNELGSTQPKRTAEWLEAGIRRCTELKRKCYAANWSVQNPKPEMHIELAKKVYPAIIANGGKMAYHEGAFIDPENGTIYRTLPECIKGKTIGGYRDEMQKYGFCVAVTEFAASKTPHDGYAGWIGDTQFAALVDDSARVVYAPDGVDRYIYTAEKWDLGRDFEYADKPQLQDKFAATNVAYPVQECKPMTQPTYPPPTVGGVRRALAEAPNNEYVNIRLQPNPNSATSNSSQDVGDLLIGDEVDAYPDAKVGDWIYIKPVNQATRPAGRQPAVNGWVSEQGGKVKLVPPLLPPTPETYTLTAEQRVVLLDYLTRSIDDLTAAKTLVEGLQPSTDGGL